MTTWLLLGGAAFLFLTPTGKALAARFTGGAAPVGGYPAGTVRLADGRYRLPSGQIVGTPTTASGGAWWSAPLASTVPMLTGTLLGWLRGLTDTSSVTTVGTLPLPADAMTMGSSGGQTADILSGGGWGTPLPPLAPLGDVTLQGGGLDFWASTDTSGWWGNVGAPLDPLAGPVPIMELSLSLAPLPELADPLLGESAGFFGIDPHIRRQPASYR